MSFQPLIVVILLIFLVIMALAVFVWFLISPTTVTPKASKSKPKMKNAPAIKKRIEPIRQTAPVQPIIRKAKIKTEPKQNKKPNLEYKEIRPEPVNKRKLIDRAKTESEVQLNNTSGQSRDNFRGLHASKVEKSKTLDPFDSFVEASKKLD